MFRHKTPKKSNFQEHKKWKQSQLVLETLSSLSYRSEVLGHYLKDIASGVSRLLDLDWSVVTFCWEDQEKVMASSLDLGEEEPIYSLHGTLTQTVFTTGKTLCIEDTIGNGKYGKPPDGYRSYLGVPLRTSSGTVIGTICSFCIQPRHYTEEEMRTVELFAERAATAIDNYNLYQQQRQFNQVLEAEVAKRTEELKAAQAKLIEQEKLVAIGKFASMIVHEIKNPVTTILMGLNAFKKIDLCDRDRMRLSLALEEADRLKQLLQEILLYAKPQVLAFSKIEINHFFENLLFSLSEMPEASERHIQWIPFPSVVQVWGDHNKLKQVSINLVRNACEAIAPGEGVTCKIEQDEKPDYIRISVCNGGTPIPEDILPKITQPFCSGKPGGTGLGLAIVKRIVDAHGGTLFIQSNRLEGTIVSFTLSIVTGETETS